MAVKHSQKKTKSRWPRDMFPRVEEQAFAPICPSASPEIIRQMVREERSEKERRWVLAEICH